MQTTWGAKLIDRVVDGSSTIKINAGDMELDGFVDDTFSEYRRRSVVRTKPTGSLSCSAPDCGKRYLGFVTPVILYELRQLRLEGETNR